VATTGDCDSATSTPAALPTRRRGSPTPSPLSSDVAIGSARPPSMQLPWFSPQQGSAEQ
jgi:hypothetical protein